MKNSFYGTLNDAEISRLVEQGQLIIEDYCSDNVKQACYEMRAGNTYFDLSAGVERHRVSDGDVILFKPHQTIVIITKEKLSLPDNILARFLTKGSLFSVGFAPVNTYADPGFYGRMGIVMNNCSNHYIKITSGDIIVKVEFSRLCEPVKTPYHGQHGFESCAWPYREDYIISDADIKRYWPEHNAIEEIRAAYGDSVAAVMRRVIVTERRFVIATIILIIVELLLIGFSAGAEWFHPIFSVALSIVANAVYAVVSWIITSLRWPKRGKK